MLFPAHAGVILQYSKHWKGHQTSPRTRGGDPICIDSRSAIPCFSPHTRGASKVGKAAKKREYEMTAINETLYHYVQELLGS